MPRVTDFPNMGQSLAQMAMQNRDQNQRANETFLQAQNQTNQLTMSLLGTVMDDRFKNRNLTENVDQSNKDRDERGRIADQSELGINNRFTTDQKGVQDRFDVDIARLEKEHTDNHTLNTDKHKEDVRQADHIREMQLDALKERRILQLEDLNQLQSGKNAQTQGINTWIGGDKVAPEVMPFLGGFLRDYLGIDAGQSRSAGTGQGSFMRDNTETIASQDLMSGEPAVNQRGPGAPAQQRQSGYEVIVGKGAEGQYDFRPSYLDPDGGGVGFSQHLAPATDRSAEFTWAGKLMRGAWNTYVDTNVIMRLTGKKSAGTNIQRDFFSGDLAMEGAIDEKSEQYYRAGLDKELNGNLWTRVGSVLQSDATNTTRQDDRNKETAQFLQKAHLNFLVDEVVKENPQLKGKSFDELVQIGQGKPLLSTRAYERAYPPEIRQTTRDMEKLGQLEMWTRENLYGGDPGQFLRSIGEDRTMVAMLRDMRKRLTDEDYRFFDSEHIGKFEHVLKGLETRYGIPGSEEQNLQPSRTITGNPISN